MITPLKIQKMKKEGIKIAALTSYDFSTAKYADEAGIDLILVGDSVGAAQLLDGENPGDGQRLWIGIPSCKLGIDLAQILHGFPAQLPHLPQIGPRGGRRVLGLAGIGA